MALPTWSSSSRKRRPNPLEGTSLGGFFSPPHVITIKGERAALAGIPAEAAYYCFAYPLECLAGQYHRLIVEEGRSEAWLFFLLVGGYAYFDSSRALIRTNALVMTESERKLTLAGPFMPSTAAVSTIRAQHRLRMLILEPLREAGFERFAWVVRARARAPSRPGWIPSHCRSRLQPSRPRRTPPTLPPSHPTPRASRRRRPRASAQAVRRCSPTAASCRTTARSSTSRRAASMCSTR